MRVFHADVVAAVDIILEPFKVGEDRVIVEELRGLTVFIILMDYRAATLTGRRRRGRRGW